MINTFKKYLDLFTWYDLSSEEVCNKTTHFYDLKPDYVCDYQSYFGMVPQINLRLINKILTISKSKKFEKYLLSQGFDISSRGKHSYKYIHIERKILISGDIIEDDDKCLEMTIDEEEGHYVSLTDTSININILPTLDNKKFINKIINYVCKYYLFNPAKDEYKFYMIAQSQNGLYKERTNFKYYPIQNDRFDLFYGKNFPHQKLKAFIKEKTENLMLLHGDPGTGKSNYIKHIITNSKKNVIYIPPSMLSAIASPGFIGFMMKNKNSILLIEDAEEVLSVDRNSATNNLLSLSDGFLKDALDLKIICTFNCSISKIDPALLRKGRLYYEYKFDNLSVEECEELADFLKIERKITKPMSLSEFFIEEDNHHETTSFEERRIGFFT